MQYVFNPRNRQINPVTEQTQADASLRSKVVSAELYALVCKGKVSIGDVAALFACNKSPEVLVKNHAAVKESPVASAPENTATLDVTSAPQQAPAEEEAEASDEPADADGAFDGRTLCSKTVPELIILAGTIGIDVNAPGFVPTRGNLIKAIRAKAAAAEAGTAAPAEPAGAAEPSPDAQA